MLISNIQRFSIHDGPGIRTTVFLKGCNMNCLWCHNPETISVKPVIQFYANKCTQCRRCIEICKNKAVSFSDSKIKTDRELCIGCGECVFVCPCSARKLNGKEMSVAEVFSVVERDRDYYDNSGGGITLSGGEPLLQSEECAALLKLSKENGINTAIETALNTDISNVMRVAEFADYFMCDIKAYDSALHKRLTGKDNRAIVNNIRYLSENGANLCIRVPVIPGCNSDSENIGRIAEFVASLPERHTVELLKYNPLAKEKYDILDRNYSVGDDKRFSETEMKNIEKIFNKFNVNTSLI